MKPDLNRSAETLKEVGFETRTLLNGITGPIQLIRSLSNDPNLLEILHILELSTIRFEKFSLRSQILADLLNQTTEPIKEEVDLTDLVKHAQLELNDLINFYGIKVIVDSNIPPLVVEASRDLLYQSVLIIFEQYFSVLDTGAEVYVYFDSDNHSIIFKANDNGFLAGKFNSSSDNIPASIELALMLTCFHVFNIQHSVKIVEKSSVTQISSNV